MIVTTSPTKEPTSRPGAPLPPPVSPAAEGVSTGFTACALAAFAILLLAFMSPAVIRWVFSEDFRPTPSDPASYPRYFFWLIPLLQYGVGPLMAGFTIWRFLIQPVMRAGRLTFDGMLVIAAMSINVCDCFINYVVFNYSYSSAFMNFGNWTAFTPGQIAPGTGRGPEPLLFVPLTYMWFLTLWVVGGSVLLKWVRQARPSVALIWWLLGLYLLNACSDVVLEGLVNVRLQLYAFMSTYPPLTLFAGKPYQFPLYNSFLWSFVLTGLAATRALTDVQGRTFVEASAERAVRRGWRSRLLACLAVAGLTNAIYIFLYFVPFTILTLNGGPFPRGLPSHLLNGYCGSGTAMARCPGPGVPIIRG